MLSTGNFISVSVSVKQTVDSSRANKDLAQEFSVSPVTVWRYKKRIGIVSSGRRGMPPKDRSSWDWSLRDVDLARQHKISRQRVGILRRRQRQIQRKLTAHERAIGTNGTVGGASERNEGQGSQSPASTPSCGNTCLEDGQSFRENHQPVEAVGASGVDGQSPNPECQPQ